MVTEKKIVPERKHCDCGKLVKNHHWLCDKCWGKKEKKKHDDFDKKITKELVKANKRMEKMKAEIKGKIKKDMIDYILEW